MLNKLMQLRFFINQLILNINDGAFPLLSFLPGELVKKTPFGSFQLLLLAFLFTSSCQHISALSLFHFSLSALLHFPPFCSQCFFSVILPHSKSPCHISSLLSSIYICLFLPCPSFTSHSCLFHSLFPLFSPVLFLHLPPTSSTHSVFLFLGKSLFFHFCQQ